MHGVARTHKSRLHSTGAANSDMHACMHAWQDVGRTMAGLCFWRHPAACWDDPPGACQRPVRPERKATSSSALAGQHAWHTRAAQSRAEPLPTAHVLTGRICTRHMNAWHERATCMRACVRALTEGDVLQLTPHAQPLAQQRHDHQADAVDQPPAPTGRGRRRGVRMVRGDGSGVGGRGGWAGGG